MRVLRGDAEFFFSVHAVFRAEERGIDGEILREVVHTGKFEEFGDGLVRISKRLKSGKIVLVGRRLSGNCVKILTVER